MSGVNGNKPSNDNSGLLLPEHLAQARERDRQENATPTMTVNKKDGFVCLTFTKEIKDCKFDPLHALNVGLAIIGNATAAIQEAFHDAEKEAAQSQADQDTPPPG